MSSAGSLDGPQGAVPRNTENIQPDEIEWQPTGLIRESCHIMQLILGAPASRSHLLLGQMRSFSICPTDGSRRGRKGGLGVGRHRCLSSLSTSQSRPGLPLPSWSLPGSIDCGVILGIPGSAACASRGENRKDEACGVGKKPSEETGPLPHFHGLPGLVRLANARADLLREEVEAQLVAVGFVCFYRLRNLGLRSIPPSSHPFTPLHHLHTCDADTRWVNNIFNP